MPALQKMLLHKMAGTVWRLKIYISKFKIYITRFINHLYVGIIDLPNHVLNIGKKKVWISLLHWLAILLLMIFDLLGFPIIYETICDWFKVNTRPLRQAEIDLGASIYGDSIRWQAVRIDERAFLGPKQRKFAYVSYHTINCWGELRQDIFIHELMHIWQYERVGSLYLFKAMLAQHSVSQYNYGGVEELKSAMQAGKTLAHFNYEQQGDIVCDYYRIKQGFAPQWGNATPQDLAAYEHFVRELKH